MIDFSKYRQIKIEFYLPDGTKTYIYKYVNIETNEIVEESVINGEILETITITCANICVIV